MNLWRYAIEDFNSSPIYIKECSNKSGHITLITVTQSPLEIKVFPFTFIDEIKKINNGDEKFLLDKKEVFKIKEKDVLSHNGIIDPNKIKIFLDFIIIDPDVNKIIKLIYKLRNREIKNHHIPFD